MPELRPALFFLLTPLNKFLVGYYLGRKLGEEYSNKHFPETKTTMKNE